MNDQVEVSCAEHNVKWDHLPFKPDLGDIELTTPQKHKVIKLFHKYQDCFCKDRND